MTETRAAMELVANANGVARTRRHTHAPRTGRELVCRIVAVVAAGMVALAAGTGGAHGPTIEISHEALEPPLLNLFVGMTVHFENTVEMPGGHVIVDRSGRLESPPLEQPGDGWHYTFEEEGVYDVFVREHPDARVRIVVVPKKNRSVSPGS